MTHFSLKEFNYLVELSHFTMKVTAAYTINVRLGSVETEVSFSWGREADQFA